MSEERKVAVFPPRARVPERPSWLRGYGAALWDQVAPEMVRAGFLDELSAEGFAAYCQTAADLRRLHRLVNRMGMHRALKARVWDALLATQSQFRELANDFLCTPASRAAAGVGGRGRQGTT